MYIEDRLGEKFQIVGKETKLWKIKKSHLKM